MLTPEMPKKALKEYHSLFYALSQLGDPVWDTSIKTASVTYNSKTGTLVWRFNPKFYEHLTDTEKAFVVAHEALHLISDHPNRIREAIYGNRKERPTQSDIDRDRKLSESYNVSADIVVNESLKRIYGFDLDTMPNLRNNLIDYDYVKRTVSPDVLKSVLAKHTSSDSFLMGLDKDTKGEQNDIQSNKKEEVEDFNEEDLLATSSMEFFIDVLKSGQVSTSQRNNQFKLNPPEQSGDSPPPEGESTPTGEPGEKGSSKNKGGDPDEHAPETEEEVDDADADDSTNPSEKTDAESTDGELDDMDSDLADNSVPKPEIDNTFSESDDLDDIEDLDDNDTVDSEDYQPSKIGMDYDAEENSEVADQDTLEDLEDLEDQDATDIEDSDTLEKDIDFDDFDGTEEVEDSDDLDARETLDEHSWNNEQQSSLSDIAQALNNQIQDMDLSQSDKTEILEELGEVCKEAGTDLGPSFSVVRPKYRPKPKWETIIKKWISNTLEEFAFTDDNWFGDKKQFQWLNATLEAKTGKKTNKSDDDAVLAVLGSELMLPGEERDSPDIHKIPVVLFLDTSGSCINYAQRFIDAARTFPTDRFDVTVYGFTTYVYDIDITKPRPKLRTGGTLFNILENKLLEIPKYPKVVFVITDGWGNRFMPKFPDRWYWFFSDLGYVRDSNGVYDKTKPVYPDYVRNLIGKCKFFDLANFE